MTINLPGYYNRFDEQWRYEDVLFRASKGLQSAELNEVQALHANRLRRIADVLFADGEVVRGTPPDIDPITGATICAAAVVYITGAMRDVPERSFTIPVVGVVQIGVYLLDEVVTEDDTEVGEPGLRDPATGTRNYNEPGAARLRQTPTWGHDGEDFDGVFWPVWTVIDGVLQGQTNPEGNLFIDLLARYDRESNGNYIVSGLSVTALDTGIFSVREGVGNIFGYKVDKTSTTRLVFPVDPELESVTSEPDVYVNGSTNIQLNRTPVNAIQEVVATREKTVSITRGGSSGGSDLMPDVSIISVQSLTQGGTTYTNPANYLLVGDSISWSPGGAEPAPGSTYSITYRYLANFTPTNVDLNAGTFRVATAVAGTLVLTDYTWKLPRLDRIALARNGSFVRIKGISNRYQPIAPGVPADLLSLATVRQTWGALPGIVNDGIRAIPFNELERMRTLVLDLFDLVAQERLLRDIAAREPTTKRGVFVDPFIDNDMRDRGRNQNAAIVGGTLMLPIKTEAISMKAANNRQDWMLPYTEEIALQQTLITGTERINPYANFDAPEARLSISPVQDRWVEVVPVWTGAALTSAEQDLVFDTIEMRFNAMGGRERTTPFGARAEEAESIRRAIGVSRPELNEVLRTLRPLTIQFTGSLFGAGEVVSSVTFAGVTVVTSPGSITANGSGGFTGSFVIPAGIPPGRHDVVATGASGSVARASFFGEVIIDISTEGPSVDPLAQTFILEQSRYITSIDVPFRVIGNTSKPVTVQIRETDLGLPTQTVLAAGSLAGTALSATGWTNVPLDRPRFLVAGREYAIVIVTDDATRSVAIAQLGKFDATLQRWVTAQPYTVGTLLKSSNASTWTPFQEADLAFRLKAAAFTSNTRTVDLGPIYRVAATGITRTSTTATVTTSTAHGITTGQTVVVSGADQPEYNIAAVATVTGANTFTMTVVDTAVTPATGTILVAPGLTSDIAVLASVQRPTSACGVEFIVKRTGLPDVRTADDGYLELIDRVQEGLRLEAVLTGNSTESPYLFSDTQVLLGDLQQSATYISRAVPSAISNRVRVAFDQFIPSAAGVTVALEKSDLSWLTVAQDATIELGDGWLEASHTEETFATSGTTTRTRLTLTGSPSSRPYIQNLRMVTT